MKLYELQTQEANPEAYKLMLQAADLGSVDAAGVVGYMFFQGSGIAKDEKKAVHWLKIAAKGNNVLAISNLGHAFKAARASRSI